MRPPLDIAIHTLGLEISGEDPVELSLGGSETAALSMARALAGLGERVTLYCNTPRPGELGGARLVPAAEIGERLAAEPCDILLSSRHHHRLDAPLPAGRVGLWFHDMPFPGMARQHRRALSRMSFALFLSRFQQAEYERAVPGIESVAHQTTNGVDFEALARATADRAPGARPTFLYASRPERGLDLLLRQIWPRLRERLPRARLRISTYEIVDPALPEELRELYRSCRELADRSPGVEELGSLPRARFWSELAGATALLYPSTFPEISCMVALEAQAAGVPALVTDAFALSETVGCAAARVGGSPGSPEFVADFVELACRTAEDQAFRAELAAAGRRHVSPASHSWEAIAGRWSELFRELLGQRPVRRTRVSALVLVRDAATTLAGAIDSLAPAADEIVIGDTGSADGTVELVESLGFVEVEAPPGAGASPAAPPPERRWVRLPFEDFAQARNALARHATGDVLYWQDADEILSDAGALRRWIDENVFFDAFSIEQRHQAPDASIGSTWPLRCYRPQTPDGPLAWVGAIHERVEHSPDRPPRRRLELPDVRLDHSGYASEEVRLAKAAGRNRELLLRDRRQLPERRMGYVLGMREYLNVAKFELHERGELTRDGYRALNLAWEIWRRHVRAFPPDLRGLGHRLSREVLALLADHRLPLAATGRIPIEVDISFAARYGRLGQPPEELPRQRVHYASVEELRQEFGRRLARLEGQLGRPFERPAELLPEGDGVLAELPPELFGVD